MSDIEADVIVVGGGMAGSVAAVRAGELGLSACVLERGVDTHYPCNTRWSGGVLHIAYKDILSEKNQLLAAMDAASNGTTDQAQALTVASQARRFIDWLRSHDTTFVQTDVEWQQLILEPMRNIRGGLDWKDRGPDRLLTRLSEAIARRNGQVTLGTRARSLIMEGDHCIGVKADVDGKTLTYIGRSVILADGGFQANLELLGQHIALKPESIKQRGAATSFGDCLTMAEAIGARITALDKFYGHLLCRDAMTNDHVWPYPEVDVLASSGILVDQRGQRFTDEGRGGIAMANELAKSDNPLGATIVFDTAIWNGPGRSARIPANPAMTDAGGTLIAADSIEELARLAGLPAAKLAESVESYNTALTEGNLKSQSPSRTTDKHPAMPIIVPPYLAIPTCAGITYTMGGVSVDSGSRVLSNDKTAIQGLYAAGAVTGGLEGGHNPTYVGGLAKAGIQGLIAAETIAADHF